MRALLRSHPLVATLGAVLLVFLGTAVAVLPRLDAIEIVSATRAPAAPSSTDVLVRYRLGAPAGGSVRVRVVAPGGREAIARREIGPGSGTVTVRLDVAPGKEGVVLAELVPSAEPSVLEPLLRARRRAVAALR